MTVLVVPMLAAALLAFGGSVLLVFERYGDRTGQAFLGAVAFCTVLGLAVSVARAPDAALGSFAQLTSRTMVR